jgi:hypothetical protein
MISDDYSDIAARLRAISPGLMLDAAPKPDPIRVSDWEYGLGMSLPDAWKLTCEMLAPPVQGEAQAQAYALNAAAREPADPRARNPCVCDGAAKAEPESQYEECLVTSLTQAEWDARKQGDAWRPTAEMVALVREADAEMGRLADAFRVASPVPFPPATVEAPPTPPDYRARLTDAIKRRVVSDEAAREALEAQARAGMSSRVRPEHLADAMQRYPNVQPSVLHRSLERHFAWLAGDRP